MNSFDCSAEKDFNIYIPGGWIVEKMGLQWNGMEGRFFDRTGKLVAFDPAVLYLGPHALLIRKDEFLSFLGQAGYEVIWFLLAGKQIVGGDWSRSDWKGELQISGVFKIEKGKIKGEIRPKFIKPRSSTDEADKAAI
jgi:hypothetical protein